MRTELSTILAVGFFGLGLGMADAADSIPEKEASPIMKNAQPKDTITGTLMRKEGEFYFIQDGNGEVQRIHIDKSTKSDSVKPGDMVKASVTAQGHATTLQHRN